MPRVGVSVILYSVARARLSEEVTLGQRHNKGSIGVSYAHI